MIDAIRIGARHGPVVLVAPEDETSSAAAAFARRAADRARVELHVGSTISESARIARKLDATLVVVPTAPHRWTPRGGAAQSASWFVARTGCPVASVAPALAAPPRACVAAVDFSAASVRAVQLALLMLDDCGTLTLIYVAPLHDLARLQHAVPCAVLGADVAGMFERLRMELWDYAPPGTVIETQIESGGIVGEVLSVAREVEADLIAVGVHPPRVSNRLFDFGSAARLLHRATCTVVASPAREPRRSAPLWMSWRSRFRRTSSHHARAARATFDSRMMPFITIRNDWFPDDRGYRLTVARMSGDR